jgi:hypothetical protein
MWRGDAALRLVFYSERRYAEHVRHQYTTTVAPGRYLSRKSAHDDAAWGVMQGFAARVAPPAVGVRAPHGVAGGLKPAATTPKAAAAG